MVWSVVPSSVHCWCLVHLHALEILRIFSSDPPPLHGQLGVDLAPDSDSPSAITLCLLPAIKAFPFPERFSPAGGAFLLKDFTPNLQSKARKTTQYAFLLNCRLSAKTGVHNRYGPGL